MRTCLTITLLLWASLASQAQAGGLVAGQSASHGTSICAGQALQRAGWIAAEQAPLFMPEYPQLSGPVCETVHPVDGTGARASSVDESDTQRPRAP